MRAPPSLALPLCWLAALAAAGCAHERDTMTFAEAGLADEAEESTEEPTPPAPGVLPEAEERRVAEGAPAHAGAGPGAPAARETVADGLDRHPPPPLPRPPPGSPPEPVAEAPRAALRGIPVVRASLAPASAALPRLHWPLDRAWISSLFGLRFHPLDHAWRMHWGVDLSAPPGRAVGAAAAGVVVHAGWSRGYGLMVEVRHRAGLTTRYSHLARLACAPGDAVSSGQPVGLVGATGRTTGPHLHFEVWHEGRARDPLAMLPSPLARASD